MLPVSHNYGEAQGITKEIFYLPGIKYHVLFQGDHLTVIEKHSDHWWIAKNLRG